MATVEENGQHNSQGPDAAMAESFQMAVPSQNKTARLSQKDDSLFEQPTQNSLIHHNQSLENQIQPSMNGSQVASSYVVEDYIYDAEIAKQVERDKLAHIKQQAQKLKHKLIEDQGRCKVCTLVPPCQHIKTISHEKQFAIASKFMSGIKKAPPLPIKRKRGKSVLPPKPDNVKQMVKDMNYTLDNNKMLTQDELFKPKPVKQVYNWTHQVQGHEEARREFEGYQHTAADTMQGFSTQISQDNFYQLPPRRDIYGHVQPKYKDYDLEKMRQLSAKKGFDHTHLRSISTIVGSKTPTNVNELVSPYSILRQQEEQVVDQAIQQITSPIGYRGNRAQVLRQLALEKRKQDKPFLAMNHKLSKEAALNLQDDVDLHSMNYFMDHETKRYHSKQRHGPTQHGDFQNGRLQTYRIRTKRGDYQTMNASKNFASTLTSFGGPQRRNSNTADSGQVDHLLAEKKNAEYRLRMVEKIAQFREQKIKKEFQRIEKDLMHQEQEQQRQLKKEQRRQNYFAVQRKKLFDYAHEQYNVAEKEEQQTLKKPMRQSPIEFLRDQQDDDEEAANDDSNEQPLGGADIEAQHVGKDAIEINDPAEADDNGQQMDHPDEEQEAQNNHGEEQEDPSETNGQNDEKDQIDQSNDQQQ